MKYKPSQSTNSVLGQFIRYVARELQKISQAISDNDGKMKWRNIYDETAKYFKNDVVRDGEWTMVANKDTIDAPAPQEIGIKDYILDDVPTWVENSDISTIHSGHSYSFSESGYLTVIRGWVSEVTASTSYRVLVADVTDGTPDYREYIPDFTANQWVVVIAGELLVVAGTNLIILLDAINSGSDTQVTGGWSNGGTDNSLPPLASNWNTNQQRTLLRIDKTDLDTVDRTSELLGIVSGSVVQFVETADPDNFIAFRTLDAPIDGGSFISYPCQVTDQGVNLPALSSPTTMTATVPVSQSTKYVEMANYWPTNQPVYATVSGVLEYDGVGQTMPDSAFGIDIQFQRLLASPDWDILSYSS